MLARTSFRSVIPDNPDRARDFSSTHSAREIVVARATTLRARKEDTADFRLDALKRTIAAHRPCSISSITPRSAPQW